MNAVVLITCHNRREKTLECLEALFSQIMPKALTLEVVLVDDGSTDETAAAVSERFPSVEIFPGSGDLFWCAGMSSAWSRAARRDPEAYLWLNDDVVLRSGALQTIFAAQAEHPHAIIIGSCVCPVTGERSYGGKRRRGFHPGKLDPIDPAHTFRTCDTFEGNIVWVPRAVYRRVGGLADFRHAMGDIDYGYRAAAAGVPLLIAPGYLGVCANNSRAGTWEDRQLPFSERVKKLRSVKGLPSADWWKFCRRHGGIGAPLFYIMPMLRILLRR